MTHSDVTLDVKRRRAGETERFHVRVHLRLEHSSLGPGAAEPGYKLVVHRATATDK